MIDTKTIADLDKLIYYVKSMEIPERNKHKIVQTVTFEKSILNTDLFLQKEKEKCGN
jgi:hypothetical protein